MFRFTFILKGSIFTLVEVSSEFLRTSSVLGNMFNWSFVSVALLNHIFCIPNILYGLYPFKLLFLFCLVLLPPAVLAQVDEFDFEPYGVTEFTRDDLSELKNRFEQPSFEPQLDNSCQRNEFQSSKEKSYAQFGADNSERRFLSQTSEIQLLVDDVLDRLIDANQALAEQDYKFIVFRSEVVNAKAQGAHIIYLNLGLIDQLESVDQLAFVMAHEMSHDYLFHSWKTRESLAKHNCDKDLKKTVKKVIRRGNYTTKKTLTTIFLTQQAKHMAHSRSWEIQADSLGFLISANAGFDPLAGRKTMDVLKKSETPLILLEDTLDMKSFFDLDGVNFDNDWLDRSFIQSEWKSQEGVFDIPDSLRSHPDTDFRKRLLETRLEAQSAEELNDLKTKFQKIKHQLAFELIEIDLEKESFDIALFRSLHLLNRNPDNPYLCAVVSWCLFHFKLALLDNAYSIYVDMPNERYTDSFNAYLCFLHNQNSRSLNRLYNGFYNAHKELIDNHWLGTFIHTISFFEQESKSNWLRAKNEYIAEANHYASINYLKEILN